MQSKHYFEFINQFKDTTFIWVISADGKNRGKIAEDIYYDADIVVNVKTLRQTLKKTDLRPMIHELFGNKDLTSDN